MCVRIYFDDWCNGGDTTNVTKDIMKVERVTLEEEETAKRERYSQVLSVEKLRFAEPQSGTRCEETKRRDANV